ncbi:peptidase M23 [Burkholderia glumae]|nr:peptidase M23 [Burkholderia glumae]
MIISPPFLLPVSTGSAPDARSKDDPLMDELDKMTDSGGIYPIAFDRRWHTGLHLVPRSNASLPVRAIADGEVAAYGVYQTPVADVFDDKNTNAGFVLLRHTTETGENRELTFYSLYMHLLDLAGMTTDGIQPPAVNEPHSMPDWLRYPTGAAVSGGGRKVRRKDILGYTGDCQGKRHLHFEIFMTPGDFDAYFGATQLGHPHVETPQGSDCWGHSYYVIPANQTFRAQPPGVDAHSKLHGIQFAPKQEGQNEHSLYVEVYFNNGDKFTNVWSVATDGSRTLLTPDPVGEPQFEYEMYKRASALYSTCASDGYEMLRFGRILSQPATLPPAPDQETSAAPNPRATWYCIPFASGQQGYIDISKPSIKKVSDADFPFFMGWRKIQAQTAPVDPNGLWDLDKLKALVRTSIGNVEAAGSGAAAAQQTAEQKSEAMRHYISDPDHKAVQALLHGFVCEAPSEWDSANLDPRYRNLLDEGEHFEGNQDAYNKFLDFVKKLQFWDKTGLPAGGKVWFFHPLAFIRHFRRCSWLALREQALLLPRKSMADAGGNILWHESKRRFSEGNNNAAGRFPPSMWLALNKMSIKYGLSENLRKAHFLGQVFKETGAFRSTSENGDADYFRKMYENYTAEDAAHDFDHKHAWLSRLGFLKGRDRSTYIAQRPGEVRRKAEFNGNIESGDGPRFRGRGLIHLTWRNGYRDYGLFRSRDFTTDPNPERLQNDAQIAADSAGYFWIKNGINRKADHGSSNSDVAACFAKVGGAGGLPARQQFFRYAYFMLNDDPNMPVDNELRIQVEDAI